MIDLGVRPGTRNASRAELTTDTPDDAVQTNDAMLTVLGTLELGRATKSARDAIGDGVLKPGELITYDLKITNPNGRCVSGAGRIDALPRYLDFIRVIPSTSQDVC